MLYKTNCRIIGQIIKYIAMRLVLTPPIGNVSRDANISLRNVIFTLTTINKNIILTTTTNRDCNSVNSVTVSSQWIEPILPKLKLNMDGLPFLPGNNFSDPTVRLLNIYFLLTIQTYSIKS